MNTPFSSDGPGATAGVSAGAISRLKGALGGSLGRVLQGMSPRQRQYATLGAILVVGVGLLWMIFALTDTRSPAAGAPSNGSGLPASVTNIGVMTPGQQVNPVDQWVGTAGRKLAQYENERDEQSRLNKDRQAFEAHTMQRFAEIEQKLTSASQAASMSVAPSPMVPPATPVPQTPTMPPASSLPAVPPPPKASSVGTLPPGDPGMAMQDVAPVLTRITLMERSQTRASVAASTDTPAQITSGTTPTTAEAPSIATFLPVSFTRGTLLGGLDAPTGGQSQSNPHPVLIRLSDNSVLPNRFRGEYRDCFVIAAGYGDISSERAYLRTENLSCVRPDGATLEVKIQGTVYGEDGKVGMRGRLVTKQGQMLANALLAGVVSGIGQGLATSSTTYSTSALGTIASSGGGGNGADAYRSGLGTGVGKALDRLAQYYIKLAENTFPVIEVDAGREIDVVITKGVRIDVPMSANTGRAPGRAMPSAGAEDQDRYSKASNDDNY
jgi:conjugal transfer pilus assembly protein TraB